MKSLIALAVVERSIAASASTLVQLAIGLGLGLAGAIVAGRFLERFLVRTAPTDPLALTLVSVLLIVVATLASVLPARRATQVDPVVALRCE
jgi:putative ABC transport system permease protein